MRLHDFNSLDKEEQKKLLEKCCGSSAWMMSMLSTFPVRDLEELLSKADDNWKGCNDADRKEAFEHHPKIGDLDSLKQKFANTKQWAEGEQAGVQQTSPEVLQALAEGNKAYEEKFGYIFIVSAAGKSAEEMLEILQSRLKNTPEEEIKIAAAEQAKITKLRLTKLFEMESTESINR